VLEEIPFTKSGQVLVRTYAGTEAGPPLSPLPLLKQRGKTTSGGAQVAFEKIFSPAIGILQKRTGFGSHSP
jgi:hypothetical protein